MANQYLEKEASLDSLLTSLDSSSHSAVSSKQVLDLDPAGQIWRHDAAKTARSQQRMARLCDNTS